MSASSPGLRRHLRAESVEPRCAYCHSLERLLGMPLETDHIIAISSGGKTVIGNLCLACRACNGHKRQIITAPDPVTTRLVKLFHPRQQKWLEHFQWSANGQRIIGLTGTGRATIQTLQMNNDLITNLRSLWVRLGLHPAE